MIWMYNGLGSMDRNWEYQRDFLRIGKMGSFLWGQVRTIRVQKTRPQNHQKFASQAENTLQCLVMLALMLVI